MEYMRADGLSQEEIDKKMLFSSTLFTDCVDRRIPPPRLLYFRVRAVFVLFGKMVDSESKKPLFNKKTWKSVPIMSSTKSLVAIILILLVCNGTQSG
eukprot:scaffold13954_cov62-Skeletonema_menzelii.AAC.2